MAVQAAGRLSAEPLASPPPPPPARRALEAYAAEGSAASATCTGGRLISAIVDPMFGTTAVAGCNSTSSYRVVAEACLGKTGCTVSATTAVFDPDPVRGRRQRPPHGSH